MFKYLGMGHWFDETTHRRELEEEGEEVGKEEEKEEE